MIGGYILYKGSMDNSNIVGYFANTQIILDSIKLSYSGIKGVTFDTSLIDIRVMDGNKMIDRFIMESLFIHTKPDHL